MTNIKVVEVCGTWTDPWTGELVRNCHKIRIREEEPTIARKGLSSEGKGWSFHPGAIAQAGADAQRAAGKKNSLAENVDACVRELLGPATTKGQTASAETSGPERNPAPRTPWERLIGVFNAVGRRGQEDYTRAVDLLRESLFQAFPNTYVACGVFSAYEGKPDAFIEQVIKALEGLGKGTPLLPLHERVKVGERPFTFEGLRVGDRLRGTKKWSLEKNQGAVFEIVKRSAWQVDVRNVEGNCVTYGVNKNALAQRFHGYAEPSHA